MNKVLTLLIALMLFSSPLWAGESPAATDKPSMSTSQTVILTAMVEAINHETREVTLRGPEGKTVSFVASTDARNLPQVQVGDIVMAEYVQSMSIEVFANDGRVYMPIRALDMESKREFRVFTRGGRTNIEEMTVYEMKSIWR